MRLQKLLVYGAFNGIFMFCPRGRAVLKLKSYHSYNLWVQCRDSAFGEQIKKAVGEILSLLCR